MILSESKSTWVVDFASHGCIFFNLGLAEQGCNLMQLNNRDSRKIFCQTLPSMCGFQTVDSICQGWESGSRSPEGRKGQEQMGKAIEKCRESVVPPFYKKDNLSQLKKIQFRIGGRKASKWSIHRSLNWGFQLVHYGMVPINCVCHCDQQANWWKVPRHGSAAHG